MKNIITKSWMGRICKMAFAAALLSFLSLSFISCGDGGDGGDSGSGSSGRSFDARDLSGSENPTTDGTYKFTDSDGGYFVFTPGSSNSDLSFDQGGSSSGTWIYYLAGAMMLRGTYSGAYAAAAAFTLACVVTEIRTGSSWATAVKSTFDFIVNAERRFQAHINKITEQTSGSSGSSGGDGSGTGSGGGSNGSSGEGISVEKLREYLSTATEDPCLVIISDKQPNLSSITRIIGVSAKKVQLDLSMCTELTEIGESAFRGISGLTSVTIPSSVTKIGESAFRGCSELTSVVFENPDGWKDGYESLTGLDNPATAANYLTSGNYYTWTRN